MLRKQKHGDPSTTKESYWAEHSHATLGNQSLDLVIRQLLSMLTIR